jgi:adenylosuccinate lyase
LSTDTDFTAAGQWFERTLDDSANKRISVSEAFLTLDAILELYINVTSGLVVYPKMIERHLLAELPFMATETILMEGVKRGKDRQLLHERIRIHSMEASRIVKEEGGENDLLQRISEDSAFGFPLEELMDLCKPEGFVGMAPDQTQDYIDSYVKPLLKSNESVLGLRGKIQV